MASKAPRNVLQGTGASPLEVAVEKLARQFDVTIDDAVATLTGGRAKYGGANLLGFREAAQGNGPIMRALGQHYDSNVPA